MFVLKSHVEFAIVFGGRRRPFRRVFLPVVGLYIAASVHPKVLQPIAFGLFSAEADLVVTRFTLASTILQFFEDDLFASHPSM